MAFFLEKNDSDKIKNESPLSKYSKKILLNSKDNRFLEKNQENMETNFSKNETLENKNTNGEDSNTSVNNSIKMKAYLAVVVSNVKELENSYKKITSLSNSVGSTKVGRNACSSQILTFGSILLFNIALKILFNYYFKIKIEKLKFFFEFIFWEKFNFYVSNKKLNIFF